MRVMQIPSKMTADNSDDTPTLVGDCFEAAVRFIQDPAVLEWSEDYYLVHGNAAALRQDEAINHAWWKRARSCMR